MSTRRVIVRILGLLVASLAIGTYAATLSALILGILVLGALLLSLVFNLLGKYALTVLIGLTVGAGIAWLLGWATPVLMS